MFQNLKGLLALIGSGIISDDSDILHRVIGEASPEDLRRILMEGDTCICRGLVRSIGIAYLSENSEWQRFSRALIHRALGMDSLQITETVFDTLHIRAGNGTENWKRPLIYGINQLVLVSSELKREAMSDSEVKVMLAMMSNLSSVPDDIRFPQQLADSLFLQRPFSSAIIATLVDVSMLLRRPILDFSFSRSDKTLRRGSALMGTERILDKDEARQAFAEGLMAFSKVAEMEEDSDESMPEVSAWLKEVLAESGGFESSIYYDLLDDPSPLVREVALFHLDNASGAVGIHKEVLENAISDPDPSVRARAFRMILEHHKFLQSKKEAFMASCADSDPKCRDIGFAWAKDNPNFLKTMLEEK